MARKSFIPAAFAVDPERVEALLHLVCGEPSTLRLHLYNTGAKDMGVGVTVTGSAVEDRLVHVTTARLWLPSQEQPLETALETRHREGCLQRWGHLFVQPTNLRRPPPEIIPAGLDIPPPFLCRGDERRESEQAWRGLELLLELGLFPQRSGHGELHLHLAPLGAPDDGAAKVTLDVEVVDGFSALFITSSNSEPS